MSEAIDYSAINWVRLELVETLRQARQALEGYAQQPGGVNALRACQEGLHQAGGSLQMVGLQGAGQLVAEMEALVEALAQDKVQQPQLAMERLLQAFYRLPGHLDRIRSGQPELPAGLLSLVNGLREPRGAEALPIVADFAPDLALPVPLSAFDPQRANELPDVRELARTCRPRFQAGLLDWYRSDNRAGLEQMYDVLEQLQRSSRLEPAARLWWLGAGIAEALLASGLHATTETRRLFGQIDRQLKQLIDVGEAAFADAIPQTLLKELLLQLSGTTCADAGRVGEIMNTYGLRVVDEGGAGSHEELLGSVAAVALEELARFREQLDGSIQDAVNSPATLDTMVAGLHGLVNSLDMGGHATASQMLSAAENRLRGMASGKLAMTEQVMQEIAGSVIAVEERLKAACAGDTGLSRGEDSTFRDGLESVLKQVVADMVQCRNAIDDYLTSPQVPGIMEGVPDLLGQVNGALQLIAQDRAALMVAQISEYIEHVMLAGDRLPDDWQLDTLADAFCSVEYHIAELGENRDHGDLVLDMAEQSLLRLGHRDNLPREGNAGTAHQAQQGAGPGAACLPVISELPVIAGDTDSEILDIFIEEVAGELQRLVDQVPRWAAVHGGNDEEMLETIRRSFHTLKGGGRMVGALALAEFSRVFEQLLNQVGAGSISADEQLRAFVMQSLEPLAQLFAQIRGGPAPDADVDAMAAQAVRLANPDKPVVNDLPVAIPEGDARPAGMPPVHGTEASVVSRVGVKPPVQTLIEADLPVLTGDADPEIVEVFLEEAAEVMAVVVEQLPHWTNDPGDSEVLTTVRRCFHTLKGSGRIAGAMRVGEFSWAIETLLNRVLDATTPVTDELIALLVRVPDALAELVNQIGGGPPPESDYQALMTAAGKLARGEGASPAGDDDQDGEEAMQPETAAVADPALLEIFARECRSHLELIRDFIRTRAGAAGACEVSEELYRALHTLAGISESAQAAPVQALAGGLYAYIAQLKEARQPVDSVLLEVLRDCTEAIGELVERLPDMSFDAVRQALLQDRIAGLPPVAEAVEDVQDQADTGDRLPRPVRTQDVQVPQPAAPAGDAPLVEDVPAPMETAAVPPVHDPYADLDPELLEVFLEEAGEIVERSETTLHAWTGDPASAELLKEFQRQLHTLKGGARMADIHALGNLSHSLETLVTRVGDGHAAATQILFELLHEAHDRLADMLEQVKARRLPTAATVLEQKLDRYGVDSDDNAVDKTAVTVQPAPQPESGFDAAPGDRDPAAEPEPASPEVSGAAAGGGDRGPEPGSQLTEQPEAPVAPWSPAAGEVPDVPSPDPLEQAVAGSTRPEQARLGEVIPARAERRKATRVKGEQVRVQADLLDSLVNYAGEISIYRSRLEQQAAAYRFNLAEFDQTISRLREQLRQFEIETETQILYRYGQETEERNPEFDPLEMDRYSNLQQRSRLLLESINDLNSIQHMLDATTREFETLLLQQSRVSTDLQEGLMRTRMIPFAGLAPRLRRIVRQAAQELGKQVELGIEGADGEMDRTVIERIVAPLEHMLRNAVDHGIETTELRRAAGKPETGTITISFHREGPEIVLRIADDGRGVDVEAIRDRACERGLIAARDDLHDSEVMQFILQAGFTTTSKVTQISGRGVGMDVVVSEVKQLGGSLHIDSMPGSGSIFTIRLPYTLAINQALLVKACEDTFCIPLGNIEGVIRVAPEELSGRLASPEARYEYAGNTYRLQHLGTLLNRGTMDLKSIAGRVPVLLVRIGEKRVAIAVEALFGHREIVVKPLGAQLSHVDGVSGATILGDGRVVLILDLAAVVRMGNRYRTPASEPRRATGARLVVMVVDDSITVRKVTTRLLQKYGFDVVTAKDGVDAMGLLQETVPDMMLLDVEMPRMDGFELATLMRNDERLHHIPIIMITSRTGDKHRERAAQIGVDHYLGKPYQEHDLLGTIHRLIGLPDSGPGERRAMHIEDATA